MFASIEDGTDQWKQEAAVAESTDAGAEAQGYRAGMRAYRPTAGRDLCAGASTPDHVALAGTDAGATTTVVLPTGA